MLGNFLENFGISLENIDNFLETFQKKNFKKMYFFLHVLN